MKVLFDHQCFVNQEYGGISRYFVEIWKEFNISNLVEVDTTISYSNNEYLSEITKMKYHQFLNGIDFKGKRILMNILNTSFSFSKYGAKDYDIFHATYYDPYFLNLIDKKPFVITFYDAIHVILGDKYSILKDKRLLENQKKVLNQASAILAISENTKRDLVNYYNIPDSKVFVTHLSSNEFDLIAADKYTIDIPSRYILFVGTRDFYKNFTFFVESIKNLLIQNDLYLVCAGGGTFNVDEINLFKKLHLSSRIKFYQVNNLSLPKLYMNALVFAFPSLYEGFGIPVLEAMYCNCPVAVSNVSSLPEVGGGACAYFNPNDSESIANSIAKIILDSDYRDGLIKSGQSQIKNFSWNSTAMKTIEVLETVLDKHK